MKHINLKFSFGRATGILELGKYYLLKDVWGREGLAILIRTNHKGFNFLVLNSFKCFFNRPIYIVDSAKNKIKKGQTIFKLVFPDNIREIIETEEGDNISRLQDFGNKKCLFCEQDFKAKEENIKKAKQLMERPKTCLFGVEI
jgi:hypothetical protein